MLAHHKTHFLSHFSSIKNVTLLVLLLHPASSWLYVELVVMVSLDYSITSQCIHQHGICSCYGTFDKDCSWIQS